MSNAVLVVNTASRNGRSGFDLARARLESLGLHLDAALAVDDPSTTVEVVRRAVDAGARLLVLGGGDGTVSRVAPVIAGTGVVLGLLPMGTANDLARTLEIPPGLDAACDVIVDGRTVDVDLGTVSGEHFVNVASVGLGTGVTQFISPLLKRHVGALAYPVAAARAYRAHRPFGARLEFPDGDHDAVDLDGLLQVAVANGRFYGGGNVAAPDAGIDEGLLDVYAIPRGTALQRAQVARHFVSGAFTRRDHVLHVTTRAVRLVTDVPMPVSVDGELAASTPVTFGVMRNGLLVRVSVSSRSARLDGVTADDRLG